MMSSYAPNNDSRHRARWLFAGALLVTGPACAADGPYAGPWNLRTTLSTIDHTTTQDGEVPIMITVPHAGNDAPSGVSLRTTGYAGLVTSRELYLRDIALGVADRLDNTHGIVPYLVIGESHRQYIDYNRDELASIGGSANEAYETSAADPYYDEYHDRIDEYVDEIKDDFGRGLIIDMHGNTSVSDKIIRGTRNGDSIWDLLEGHEVIDITASEEPYAPGETADMAHDGNLGTRWKSYGLNEWIEFDLGSNKTIGSVEIAITEGDDRLYDFEIEVWNGSSWDVVYDGTNVEETIDFEIYEFTPVVGSKVRMSCHGYDTGQANYVKEIRIQEYGWDPIVGSDGLFGELASAGYSLQPSNSEYGVGAETTFIGGFTVDHHGSENGGLDAVQLEIGLNYRDTQAERDQLIIDIAAAIDSYYTHY